MTLYYLTYIKSNNGKHLELFLNEVQCVDKVSSPCKTIDNYRNSKLVKFHGIILRDDNKEIPDMKVYRTVLIDALLKEFNSYFPDGYLDSFSAFDPKNMPDPSNLQLEHIVCFKLKI